MLEELQKEVEAALLKIPKDFTHFTMRFDIPKVSWNVLYVTFDGHFYFLNYLDERGNRNVLYSTERYENMKYACLKEVVQYAAAQNPEEERVWFEDSRRRMFQKHLEYMALLDPECEKKLEYEINEILDRHPYEDLCNFEGECICFSEYFLNKYIRKLTRVHRKEAKKILQRIVLYQERNRLCQMQSAYLQMKGNHETAIDGSKSFAEHMKMHYRKFPKTSMITYKKYLKSAKFLSASVQDPAAFAERLIPEMHEIYEQLNEKVTRCDAAACEKMFCVANGSSS